MNAVILRIYGYFRTHRFLCACLLIISTLLLSMKLLTIDYKEDISDFLPLDRNHQKSLKIFQDISGANRLFAIVQYKDSSLVDPDTIVAAIQAFSDQVKADDTDGMVADLVTQVNMDALNRVVDFIYGHIPLFLSSSDYERMDSLLRSPDYIREQLMLDKEMMMLPSGGLVSDNIEKDPLNLFSPLLAKLQTTKDVIRYEMYDGYIFSPDLKKGIVMMTSPFGPSETEKNTSLVDLLECSASKVLGNYPELDIHILGGPAIAVGNANRIKTDSYFSITIAIVLISLLLVYCFRNFRNLLLIVLSIVWGWLFAMAGLSLFHNNVSIIVVGISSVIIGIAVNYPLHFIAHLSHTPDTRKTLKEIVSPLLIGNITTVGAFMALIPIDSIALRDLGIFCSFLLIGTILFVLIFLPHLAKVRPSQREMHLFDCMDKFSLDGNPKVTLLVVVLLTGIFAVFGWKTSFDSNMNHINYMTDEQKEDMAYFSNMVSRDSKYSTLYLVSSASTLDSAITRYNRKDSLLASCKSQGIIEDYEGCGSFLASLSEQKERIERWHAFVNEHQVAFDDQLALLAKEQGFSAHSFDAFSQIIHQDYVPMDAGRFDELTHTVFSSKISKDESAKEYYLIHSLSVEPDRLSQAKDLVEKNIDSQSFCFDIGSMNSTIATNLSDNFNYIGWACGFIVFFFLWFSFGSIELAMLSFLPMAISWIWILGLMSILHIQFNIVNIILATFIFGQGDDYTIFMTEGASYEYAYRRKMLKSYKSSIIMSALIMFIGIGTLIIAKHPALHSLAEVTIVGMFSVVLMAYLIPPLVFKWLVMQDGGMNYRRRPVSMVPLFRFVLCAVGFFIQLSFVYIIGFVLFTLTRANQRKRLMFQKVVHHLFAFDLKHLPSISIDISKNLKRSFDMPSMIVSNHQSMLDSMVFMAMSHQCILVANENVSQNWVIRKIFDWMGHLKVAELETNMSRLEELCNQGYSIVIFPEGKRNPDSSIGRFHKGAFYLAEKLGLDIVPVFLHGLNDVLPRNSFCLYSGRISVMVGERIQKDNLEFGASYKERTSLVHHYYVEHYSQLASEIETLDYYAEIVIDRYRYKGSDLFSSVKRNIHKIQKRFGPMLQAIQKDRRILVVDDSYGEIALWLALVHHDIPVSVYTNDSDVQCLVRYSAEGMVTNLGIVSEVDLEGILNDNVQLLVFNESDAERFCQYDILKIF